MAYDGDALAQHKLAEIYTDPSPELIAEITVINPKYTSFITTLITQLQQDAKKGDKLATLSIEGMRTTNYSKAIRWYKEAAMQGYAPSQNNLGEAYLKGKMVAKNILNAIKLFVLAAKQRYVDAKNNLINLAEAYLNSKIELSDQTDHATAQNILGEIYLKGDIVPKNEIEAVKLFKLASEQGNAAAQNNLGEIYLKGKIIPKNEIEAIKLFKLASEQGNAAGQNNLGEAYMDGKLIPKNEEEAVKLFKLSAAQNNAAAQANLGLLHKAGKHVPKDLQKAFELFTVSAKQHHPAGQCHLGVMYLFVETFKDVSKGLELLNLSSNQGFSLAKTYLGKEYLKGNNVPKDLSLAIKLLHQAADNDCPYAQLNLAAYYETGTMGLPKDESKAKSYYIKSAEQEYHEAKYCLATKYLTGTLFPTNRSQGLKLLQASAAQNCAPAQRFLADEYNSLEGFTEDDRTTLQWYQPKSSNTSDINKGNKIRTSTACIEKRNKALVLARIYQTKAFDLYTKAAEQNDDLATYRLALIFTDGNLINPKDDTKALMYLKKAAELGELRAQYLLGQRFANGDGVEKNDEEANKWLKQSADQGCCDAQYALALRYRIGYGIQKNIEEANRLDALAAEQDLKAAQPNLSLIQDSRYSTNGKLKKMPGYSEHDDKLVKTMEQVLNVLKKTSKKQSATTLNYLQQITESVKQDTPLSRRGLKCKYI